MRLDTLADKPPQYLYHGGLESHVESILSQGLLINPPSRTWPDTNHGGVYLSETPGQCLKWVRHAEEFNKWPRQRVALYRIDTSLLDPRKFERDHIGVMGDWRYTADIPPTAIKKER